MRDLIIQNIIAYINRGRHEFPCGFETMVQEEGFNLPERYSTSAWVENSDWITEVVKIIPKLSDKLLLETYNQFLCYEFR